MPLDIKEEEKEDLMDVRGEVRGLALKAELELVKEREGNEGLRELEDALSELGFPDLTLEKVKTSKLYPLRAWGFLLVSMRELFGYKEEDFIQIGQYDVKLSRLIKLFVQSFVSVDMVFNVAETMWRKYFTVGKLEVAELNKKENYIVVRLRDFYLHPLHCQVFKGHFLAALQMIFKNHVSCQEEKCIYEGDDFHEFILKWK